MPMFILPKWALRINNLIAQLIQWLLGLRLDAFAPGDGWPGTLITLAGHGFSTNRDDNIVTIGGALALIIEAETNQLVVLAGQNTVSGPIEIKVGAKSATSSGHFKVNPYPDATDVGQAGAPVFFHGPQLGTPKTNVKNQKVQVVIAFPTDHDPGTPAQRTMLRNDVIARFDNAKLYWNQASYGSTTWDMVYSDWIAMPKNRRFYFWEQGDVDDARLALMRATARPVARNGTTVAHALSVGWAISSHPSGNSLSKLSPTLNPDGSRVLSIKLNGNTAYIGTQAGGLFIYDITSPASPILRGSVTFTVLSVFGIDLMANTAVLALGDGGLGLVDVTNASAPFIALVSPTTADMAFAVKTIGSRVYIGHGGSLRIYDIVGTTITVVATVPAGTWVTGIDGDGTALVVSTDGQGLQIFESVAGGALARSTYLGVTRVRGVRVSGGRAYLAANDSGVVMLDITNLAAPAKIGEVAPSKPVFGLDATGSELILGGSVDLMAVDVSDAANPSITATETGVALEPDLAKLRTNLANAANGQALVKNGDRLYIDILKAFFAATGTTASGLDAFEGVILVVNGGFLRGQSGLRDSFNDGADNVTFNGTKGVIYFATDAVWGRIAHEIGHWLGMYDIYSNWNDDGTYIQGTAADWCLAGNHDSGPLFCGHHMMELMKFYKFEPPGDPNINVVNRTWAPNSSLDETFDIVAHDAAQDTDPNRVHVVKLIAATGLAYYLEVRQKPTGLLFDQNIPLTMGAVGEVIVLRVAEGNSVSNTYERPIMLAGQYGVGGKFVDAARNLIVSVESIQQNTPMVFRVRVQWGQAIGGDPNGKFDLTITPWNTDNWETVDIWVDSPRNNAGPMPVYEFHEAGSPNKPTLNGDRPWVFRENTIFARVRNTGPQAVPEAWVSCYVNSPPGIGDDGNWALLETQKISLTGADPAIPGSGETVVGFKWKPKKGEHTCIRVAMLPQVGEIETNNNFAQENVFAFDSAAASSHQPVLIEAMVRSPFSIWRKVDLRVRGLPKGWHAVVDKSWVWVPGKGSHAVRAVVWTDLGAPGHQDREISKLALTRIEGWTSFDHRYLPIGGILAAVKAVKRRKIDISAEGGSGVVYVWGKVDPPLANVPVTLELTAPAGNTVLGFASTNASGEFRTEVPAAKGTLPPDKYSVQGFITAGADAAEADSNIVVVTVNK